MLDLKFICIKVQTKRNQKSYVTFYRAYTASCWCCFCGCWLFSTRFNYVCAKNWCVLGYLSIKWSRSTTSQIWMESKVEWSLVMIMTVLMFTSKVSRRPHSLNLQERPMTCREKKNQMQYHFACDWFYTIERRVKRTERKCCQIKCFNTK